MPRCVELRYCFDTKYTNLGIKFQFALLYSRKGIKGQKSNINGCYFSSTIGMNKLSQIKKRFSKDAMGVVREFSLIIAGFEPVKLLKWTKCHVTNYLNPKEIGQIPFPTTDLPISHDRSRDSNLQSLDPKSNALSNTGQHDLGLCIIIDEVFFLIKACNKIERTK